MYRLRVDNNVTENTFGFYRTDVQRGENDTAGGGIFAQSAYNFKVPYLR